MEQQETYKIKVSYSKIIEVKAISNIDAMNKAVDFYNIGQYFDEVSADIIENISEN